jgi:MFS family permease
VSQLLIVLALIIAAAAAVRSTWSPCGLSMLSTITPLTERGRGRRFAGTATWFVLGAVLGGLTLGLGAAMLAAVAKAVGLSSAAALALAAAAALVTAGSDLEVVGRQLPGHPRQVNEQWLDRYRAWVYGAGFGWQIGVGLATYIMTAAVYLVIVMAALTTQPVVALMIGGFFGLVRGLAILLTAGVSTPAQLRSFHRRFAAWGEPVRRVVIAVQLAAAVVASTATWGLPGAAGSVVIAATMVAITLARRAPTVSPVESVESVESVATLSA